MKHLIESVGWIAVVLLALTACGPHEAQDSSGAASSVPPVPAAPISGASRGLGAATGNPGDCVEGFDPSIDYFPERVVPQHAEQFAVEYHRHYKVVTLAAPWPGAEIALRYLLVQCGTPRPSGYDGVATIAIPARSVITTSTTELPHIVRLGLIDRLVGHDEFDWVSSPEIVRRIAAGRMIEVGSGSSIDVERVLDAEPGLLLVDSFGDPETDMLGKLREVGVPVVLAPSFLEATALGRAEWIRYTALFFNRERQAEIAFAAVAERYAELAEVVASAGEARPTVFTGAPAGEVWHVPGGRSFFALLLADAGARYLWAENDATGSLALDVEGVYERALEADFWLQPSTVASREELLAFDERFAATRALQTGRVFNNNARLNPAGGNDYWETGTARPDLVLADLIEIFHPDLLDHDLVFHRRLD